MIDQLYNTSDPNPLDVVRTATDGYAASNGELVITDQSSVELPPPQQNGVVAIRDFGQEPTLTTPSGTIQGYTDRVLQTQDTVYLVSDGSDWYTVSDQSYLGAPIPDTVTRPADDDSFSSGGTYGLFWETNDPFDFDEVKYRISGKVSGQTTAYLRDEDANSQLATKDISALNAGDVFTITANYQSNTNYNIYMDAGGADFTVGHLNNASFPFTGSDIDITDGNSGGATVGDAYAIDAIGGEGL